MKKKVKTYIQTLQNQIIANIERQEHKAFNLDKWERLGGGGGITAVIENAKNIEKGGVNSSEVYGKLNNKEQNLFKSMLAEKKVDFKGDYSQASFYATGISIVMHGHNPFVPTVHANYRYFELESPGNKVSWFGGGADLTPSYYFKEDETYFHKIYKQCCDKFNINIYEKYKLACDNYFYLPHRKEYRGVGGIFFDYLKEPNMNSAFNFVKLCGDKFCESYLNIVSKRANNVFTEDQKLWQKIRRGRYAEFNLIYDKGTLFGLRTEGRTESILMSLPPDVAWHYNYKVKEKSLEKKLMDRIKIK
eukprot:COSAG01_NODE_14_length_41020_cov_40.702133_40_plen_304_part_00